MHLLMIVTTYTTHLRGLCEWVWNDGSAWTNNSALAVLMCAHCYSFSPTIDASFFLDADKMCS